MANESFCGPCHAMLATKDPGDHRHFHHSNGESFRRAIEMGCRICLQTWAGYGQPTSLYETKWRIQHDPEQANAARELQVIHKKPTGNWGQSFKLDFQSKTQSIHFGSNTGSDQSFDFLKTKYHECLRSHSKCHLFRAEPYLPARLLDVRDSGQNEIYLTNQNRVPPNDLYATLSHCWGAVQPLKLTSSTSSALFAGINVSLLPKTFQHAVHVARRLNIRWLWIDSLCIFQDNIQDWAVQSAAMQDIYQCAVLNIAATAAPDGTSGLFQKRDPRTLTPFNVKTAWHAKGESFRLDCPLTCTRILEVRDLIYKAPLNSRAWVMQERQLSRRIIHFTSEILYWECHELFANELHPTGLTSGNLWYGSQEMQTMKRLLEICDSSSLTEPLRDLLYHTWDSFLREYSRCKLTYEIDRLPAMTGLAKRFALILEDELVAGLWRTRFLEQLCWVVAKRGDSSNQATSHQPLNRWVAPTWSWASCTNCFQKGFEEDPSQRQYLTKLVDLSVEAMSSGALIHGSMKLECRLIVSRFKHEQISEYVLAFSDHHLPYEEDAVLLLDKPDIAGEIGTEHEVRLLPILQEIDKAKPHYKTVTGIAVLPSIAEEGAYERIGLFWGFYSCAAVGPSHKGWTQFYAELMKRYDEADDQIIKII